MFTIFFGNEKGGVGKTSISVNTAYLFGVRENMKVLFIDNDQQGNASLFFGIDTSDKPTISDILVGDNNIKDVILHTRYENIDIIPADKSLVEADYALMKSQDVQQYSVLKNALSEVADDYHICIIDNPPNLSTFSVLNALVASDSIVTVAAPNEVSFRGVLTTHDVYFDALKYNPSLVFDGVLVNFFKSDDSGFDFVSKLNSIPVYVFDEKITHIPGKINSSFDKQLSIFEYCPQAGFARCLNRWFQEYVKLKFGD